MWIFSRTTLRGILYALRGSDKGPQATLLKKNWKSTVYFLLHWKTKWIIYIYSPFLGIIDQPESDYLSRCRLILNNNTDILTCYTMNRLVLIYNVEKSTLFNASPNILHRVVYKGGQNVDFGPIWKHQSN